jgi:hypothetical protein
MERKSAGTQAALIGLLGTLLASCSGCFGAALSAVVAVYAVGREQQHVALAAPESRQVLSINTGDIFISRQEAAALDPETYFVDLDRGLAIRRPASDWNQLEEMTLGEQITELGGQCLSLCDQPVYRIRYGQPIEIQSDRQVLVNGRPISEQRLNILEQLYGPPPWTVPYYSQVIVNVFERSATEQAGLHKLPDLVLLITAFSNMRVNRLIAEEGSDFVVLQTSGTYENVRLAGEPATFTLEDWILLAEAENAYYSVEIAYTPQSGQSLQVWDDLQAYMDSFRVIR